METLQRNLCAKAKDLRSGLWSKSAKLGPPEELARLLRAIHPPSYRRGLYLRGPDWTWVIFEAVSLRMRL